MDGRVLTGPNAIAGEWGHNPLPWPRDDERPGPPCYCGKAGCIETYLSGPGLARDYREATGRELEAARDRGARRAGRGGGRGGSGALRGSGRASAGDGRQRPGPGRGGAGRRTLARQPALPQRAAAVAGVGVLGPHHDRARPAAARRLERGSRRGLALGRRPGTAPTRRYNPACPTASSTPATSSAPSRGWRGAWRRASPARGWPASAPSWRRSPDAPPPPRRGSAARCWRYASGSASWSLLILVGLAVTLGSLQVQLGPPRCPSWCRASRPRSTTSSTWRSPRSSWSRSRRGSSAAARSSAFHELRAIAHVIDMHQLTKDPELVLRTRPRTTGVLAPRSMSLLRAVALPRLLLGGALAHRQARRALRAALRRPGRARRPSTRSRT